MLINNYKLQFVLLLATVSRGLCCKSFEDVAAFNKTTSVLSAPGFVKSLTTPSIDWQKYNVQVLITRESVTGTVTPYGTDGIGSTRLLNFKETITVRIPGTGNWAGFNASATGEKAKDVKWTEFMNYFANGGVGVVIHLENISTLTLEPEPVHVGLPEFYTAVPEKLYTVAIAVQHEVEIKIVVRQANILTVSMVEPRPEEVRMWMATDDGVFGMWMATDDGVFGDCSNFGNTDGCVMGLERPNQCLHLETHAETSVAPTPKPTPSPTFSGAATIRGRGGMLATTLSLAVAASLALR